MKTYYDKELEAVLPNEKSQTLSIQIRNVSTSQKTNFMDLNNESIKSIRKFLNKLEEETSVKVLEETHTKGMLSIENIPNTGIADFGIQIGYDSRVWICINGIAFIRFKPEPGQKAILDSLRDY
jgi:hypothetical protein